MIVVIQVVVAAVAPSCPVVEAIHQIVAVVVADAAVVHVQPIVGL
jgi:hypothetical protein